MSYKEQIQKVFKSLASNNPYLYKDVDFKDLLDDWVRHFERVNLPPDKVYEVYEEALNFKVKNNSSFGSVSQLDMLAAWQRLQDYAGMSSHKSTCDICGGAGFFVRFNIFKGRDELLKCVHCLS